MGEVNVTVQYLLGAEGAVATVILVNRAWYCA